MKNKNQTINKYRLIQKFSDTRSRQEKNKIWSSLKGLNLDYEDWLDLTYQHYLPISHGLFETMHKKLKYCLNQKEYSLILIRLISYTDPIGLPKNVDFFGSYETLLRYNLISSEITNILLCLIQSEEIIESKEIEYEKKFNELLHKIVVLIFDNDPTYKDFETMQEGGLFEPYKTFDEQLQIKYSISLEEAVEYQKQTILQRYIDESDDFLIQAVEECVDDSVYVLYLGFRIFEKQEEESKMNNLLLKAKSILNK